MTTNARRETLSAYSALSVQVLLLGRLWIAAEADYFSRVLQRVMACKVCLLI